MAGHDLTPSNSCVCHALNPLCSLPALCSISPHRPGPLEIKLYSGTDAPACRQPSLLPLHFPQLHACTGLNLNFGITPKPTLGSLPSRITPVSFLHLLGFIWEQTVVIVAHHQYTLCHRIIYIKSKWQFYVFYHAYNNQTDESVPSDL